jgi:hypothetical protein
MATKKPTASSLFCMRIELDDVTPPIWRRFWIEGGATLAKLHHTIQVVMGWDDYHLHEFQIAGVIYSVPDPDGDDPKHPVVDERQVELLRVLAGISAFGYQYDFGDGWQHTIKVEQTAPPPKHPLGCAYVDAGARACPPEDAGGPRAYQEFLDELARNPKSKLVRAFLRWASEDFDPERFDRDATNASLMRIASNQWDDD